MAKKALDISPVFSHRKSSDGLLGTAEELVDSLDHLAICLRHIEEKYLEEEQGKVKDKNTSLFTKLKENLENASRLTEALKREKWRLSRREMSVELRMGELEDYKTHMKKDMSDMNQTVDVLSMRIVQLENFLCEAQELQETTEAEKKELEKQLEEAKKNTQSLETKLRKVSMDLRTSKLQRTDSLIRKEFDEMKNENEVLLLENQRLKELIRETEGELARSSVSSAGDAEPVSPDPKKDSTDSKSVCSANSDGPAVVRQSSEVAFV